MCGGHEPEQKPFEEQPGMAPLNNEWSLHLLLPLQSTQCITEELVESIFSQLEPHYFTLHSGGTCFFCSEWIIPGRFGWSSWFCC